MADCNRPALQCDYVTCFFKRVHNKWEIDSLIGTTLVSRASQVVTAGKNQGHRRALPHSTQLALLLLLHTSEIVIAVARKC